MEAMEQVESSLPLPLPPRELNTSLRDSDAGLIAEEGIIGCGSLPTTTLVGPEVPELLDQGIRQEHVPGSAPFRDIGSDSDPSARRAVREEHVSNVQAHYLGKAEAGAERQAVDDVVADVPLGSAEDRLLF